MSGRGTDTVPLGRAAVGLLAGAAGGLLLTWLRVPAGTLVGAVLGSAAAGGLMQGRPPRSSRNGAGPESHSGSESQPEPEPEPEPESESQSGPRSHDRDEDRDRPASRRPYPQQDPRREPQRPHPLQRWVRTGGLVLIGCVSAARLDGKSLHTMGRVALPVLGGVLLLLALNAVLARWLIKRRRIDPTTAVLACAPGGLSELSVLAVKEGADVGTVTVVHLLRVLLVVLVVLPALVHVLGRFT